MKKPAAQVSDVEGEVSSGTAEEVFNSEDEDDDDVDFPVCHICALSCQWICCDNCNVWYHTHCTDANPDDLPEMFHCLKCM